MNMKHFIAVGENIHCTRTVRSGGGKTIQLDSGGEAVKFKKQGKEKALPLPENWGDFSPAYGTGKIKHTSLAAYLSVNSDSKEICDIAEDYLCYLADTQIAGGAKYLDINTDEYTANAGKNTEIMSYLAGFYSERYEIPLSIDSSNPAILRAGLEKCRKNIKPPMINSVSLERIKAANLIKEFDAEAVITAAGREDLPVDLEGRIKNLRELTGILDEKGVPREKMHIDPLCFPVGTNPENGKSFLEAVSRLKQDFPDSHCSGGLSNISFGMPNRKLLNMVFIHLFVDAGGDGGLVDTAATPLEMIEKLDTDSESFRLARDVLTGQDQFGMAYISAHREGKLQV